MGLLCQTRRNGVIKKTGRREAEDLRWGPCFLRGEIETTPNAHRRVIEGGTSRKERKIPRPERDVILEPRGGLRRDRARNPRTSERNQKITSYRDSNTTLKDRIYREKNSRSTTWMETCPISRSRGTRPREGRGTNPKRKEGFGVVQGGRV